MKKEFIEADRALKKMAMFRFEQKEAIISIRMEFRVWR